MLAVRLPVRLALRDMRSRRQDARPEMHEFRLSDGQMAAVPADAVRAIYAALLPDLVKHGSVSLTFGEPRKDEMVSVRYAPEVVAAVKEHAGDEGLSVSEWLRRATLRALERPAGLIPDSGRQGEPRSLPSSLPLRVRTFTCRHFSIGSVAGASCSSCGPLGQVAA